MVGAQRPAEEKVGHPGAATSPLQKEQGTVPEGNVHERMTIYTITEELWTRDWET